MLCGTAYRENQHTVLVVDTRCLLNAWFDRVILSPINRGNKLPYPQPRGLSIFLSPNEYPFDS